MAYVANFENAAKPSDAGHGNWVARLGRTIWLAMMSAQESQGAVLRERHRRDDLTR